MSPQHGLLGQGSPVARAVSLGAWPGDVCGVPWGGAGPSCCHGAAGHGQPRSLSPHQDPGELPLCDKDTELRASVDCKEGLEGTKDSVLVMLAGSCSLLQRRGGEQPDPASLTQCTSRQYNLSVRIKDPRGGEPASCSGWTLRSVVLPLVELLDMAVFLLRCRQGKLASHPGLILPAEPSPGRC